LLMAFEGRCPWFETSTDHLIKLIAAAIICGSTQKSCEERRESSSCAK
jgi:hypothetical protein